MARVETTRFGTIEVADDEVVVFDEGLVGFPDTTRACLLPIDEDGLFFWLQDLDDPAVAFLVLTPWPLFPDYEPVLDEADQEALQLESAGDAVVFCVVTSHDEPRRFTANLLGPLVINEGRRIGRQATLRDDLPTQAELPSPG